jgi:hypothetical protein
MFPVCLFLYKLMLAVMPKYVSEVSICTNRSVAIVVVTVVYFR